MNEEETTAGAIFSLVIGGFVFWVLTPLNPYLPFDIRLFALLCWGGAVLVIVATIIALVSNVSSSMGGR